LQVQGVVATDPEAAGTAMRLRLAVERIRSNGEWADVSGDVLVTLRESSALVRRRDAPYLRYGDRLLLKGALSAPPKLEGFDYPRYLARQGIGTVMSFPHVTLLAAGQGGLLRSWLHGLRRDIAASLADVVAEPQASLGQALLLGLKDDLPDDLVDRFRETGTSHLLAISGLHVGILLGVALAASQWLLGRRRQHYLLAPLVLMWLYAALAGMSPSVVRAVIMGSVYLVAMALGRPRGVLPALGLAAALMVALDPPILLSVSFQLSFAAMAGIAVLAEPISSRMRSLLGDPAGGVELSSSLLGFVAYSAAMTIAATLATLPLVAFYFQQISLVGLPATMLALPALPLVLVSHALAGLLGLAATWLALPFGWLAWAASSYVIGVVGVFARLPVASLEIGGFGPALVWVYYAVLLLAWFGARRISRLVAWRPASQGALRRWFSGRAAWSWAVLPAVAVAALVWTAALSMTDGRLHVTFADVGQGDATLIVTPGGTTILVDGGPDPLAAARLMGERLPFWDRSVDLVVLTQAHADHARGLAEVLRRYDVGRVLERAVQYESAAYAAWRQAVEAEGAEVIQASAGQVIATEDGVLIEVLWPPQRLQRGTTSDIDNASVVLRLVYGDVSFLLTGDIFSEAEGSLTRRGATLDSDVLKVAHHGSRSSSSAAFLDQVSPAVAVISAGEDNSYGHPRPETMQALRRAMADENIFLTSESGSIEFTTDGSRLEVRTER
jgi:competence protein ComEC